MNKTLNLSPQFTTVTTLSKLIAMALFVALPFIGFWLGMTYQSRIDKPFMDSVDATTQPISTSDAVMSLFIEKANIPELQDTKILVDDPSHNLKVFKIRYGAPQDCQSGCFYSDATGIEYNEKIGWISVNNYESTDSSNFTYYDFDSTDTYLYSPEFFELLDTKDTWVYQNAFLFVLAHDEDVPRGVLLTIAEHLSNYIQPSLALALLENPTVTKDREILTVLTNSPVFAGDAYNQIRIQAQELLDQL